jgi:hypothetical protein
MEDRGGRSGAFPDRMTSFAGRLNVVSQLVAEEMIAEPPERPAKRLTIPHLLALVVVIAVVLSVQRLRQHQIYRLERAAYHEDLEVFHGGGFPSHMAADDAVLFVAVMPRHSKLVSFHREMRLKWEQGARRPWVRVAPDPPEPK